MLLTTNFSLEDLTAVGPHKGIYNVPDEGIVQNLKILAAKLEEMRAIFCEAWGNTPVLTPYGYRSPGAWGLNKAVGGSPTSAHCFGLGADTVVRGHSIEEMFKILTEHPTFMKDVDQLILERGCLHLGLLVPGTHPAPRREMRGDAYVDGRRTYPLLGIWKPKENS